jgi:mono/diheme cytochrome c family protein
MRKLAMFLAIAIAVCVLTIPSLATDLPSASEQKTGLLTHLGEHDFNTYCAACHGVGGRGDGTVAEFLTIAAADLTQLRKKNAGMFPRERVIEVIDGRAEVKVHGPRDMPVWGDWFDAEAAAEGMSKAEREAVVSARISALVSFIETIQE